MAIAAAGAPRQNGVSTDDTPKIHRYRPWSGTALASSGTKAGLGWFGPKIQESRSGALPS
ncbi:hypothetical protein D3C83_82010 [compost metagenome]